MYEKIKTKDDYDFLLKSGMFFEFHPELSGNWEKDKCVIADTANYTNTNTISDSIQLASTWTITNKLRWKETVEYRENGSAKFDKELQQMSISNTGEQKWEAVEFVSF